MDPRLHHDVGEVVPDPLAAAAGHADAIGRLSIVERRGARARGGPLADAALRAPALSSVPAVAHRRNLAVALLVAARPRQWPKNLLVFAAPAAAGVLGRPGVAGRTSLAAGIFLVASAGTYLVNDAIDAPLDRRHPVKRHRPVASGQLAPRTAVGLGAMLLATAIAVAGVVAGGALAVVVATYVAITLAYSLWLKRVPVIELGCVSAGFVLRAIAGGAAAHVAISPWFAIVTSAAALAVVVGKRSAELLALGDADASSHREVLAYYSRPYLRTVGAIAAAVAIMSYALWAFERASLIDGRRTDADNVLFELSILPFVLGVLSFALAAERGEAGAPEDLVLHNRALQLLGASCLALVAFGVYT